MAARSTPVFRLRETPSRVGLAAVYGFKLITWRLRHPKNECRSDASNPSLELLLSCDAFRLLEEISFEASFEESREVYCPAQAISRGVGTTPKKAASGHPFG